MTRNATDALARLTPATRAHVVSRAVALMLDAMQRQTRRRGLPMTCPFPSCAWEASRVRVSPRTKGELRDHLLSSHCTALTLMEGHA